jgi:hypothetical protein
MMRVPSPSRSLLLLVCELIVSGTPAPAGDLPNPASSTFRSPQRVTIEGYDDDAMEPFVTRDGKYLFFNNLNEPRVDTNLHWTERVDDLHFKYRGEIRGVKFSASPNQLRHQFAKRFDRAAEPDDSCSEGLG